MTSDSDGHPDRAAHPAHPAHPADASAVREPDEREPDEREPAERLAEPAAPRPGRRRRGRLVLVVLAGVVVLAGAVGVGGLVALGLFGEDPPTVGDCLTDGATADDMTVVDCGAPEAYWSVIGDDGVWSYVDFEAAAAGEMCVDHPASQQALWVTSASQVAGDTDGDVLCLEPLDAQSAE